MSCESVNCNNCEALNDVIGAMPMYVTCFQCGSLIVKLPSVEFDKTSRGSDQAKDAKPAKSGKISSEKSSLELAEPPIDVYIRAQQATKKYVRKLRRLYPVVFFHSVRHVCCRCHLPCLLAGSTEAERVKLEGEGKRVEVICSLCYPEDISSAGGVTEGQAIELSEALLKKAGQEGRN